MEPSDKFTTIELLYLIKNLAEAQHAGERAEIAERIGCIIQNLENPPEPDPEAPAAT